MVQIGDQTFLFSRASGSKLPQLFIIQRLKKMSTVAGTLVLRLRSRCVYAKLPLPTVASFAPFRFASPISTRASPRRFAQTAHLQNTIDAMMYETEILKEKIQELRDQGNTAEQIITLLDLPFDIDHVVSETNQSYLWSITGESGDASEQTAEIISLLRSYNIEDNLSSTDREHYKALRSKYEEINSQSAFTTADREAMRTILAELKKILHTP